MSSRTRKLIIFSALAVLVLVPVFFPSCGQASGKTPTPTVSPRQSVQYYTNAKYSLAFKFPQYWVDEELTDPVVSLTGPPPEGATLPAATIQLKVIEKVPEEVLKGTLEDYMLKCEENLKKDAGNYTRLSLESVQIDNLPAMVLTWSMSAEKALITKQAIFFKGDSAFIFTYSALEEFSDRYVSAFDLVTSSFKFY